MKKFSGCILLSLSMALVAVSCSKKQTPNGTSGASQTTTANRAPNAGGGYDVSLHRGKGVKRSGVGQGNPCECARCFGMCLELGGGTDINVISTDMGNGQAKLYILQAPDDDVLTDPTMYVDDDVFLTHDASSMTVKAGAYHYTSGTGTIAFNGRNYAYFGTVVVNFE